MESLANIAIGLVVQCTGQLFLLYVLNVPMSGQQFLIFTIVMTVLSVVRSYIVRRMWNAEWWKRFEQRTPPFEHGCRCVYIVSEQRYETYGCPCPRCEYLRNFNGTRRQANG